MRIKALLVLTAAALSLSACATADRYDAAGDVHALLTAIRARDRAAFDARVDRQALKYEIEARLLDEAEDAAKTIRAYQGLLSGKLDAFDLLDQVQALEKLGVTEGTLAEL